MSLSSFVKTLISNVMALGSGGFLGESNEVIMVKSSWSDERLLWSECLCPQNIYVEVLISKMTVLESEAFRGDEIMIEKDPQNPLAPFTMWWYS